MTTRPGYAWDEATSQWIEIASAVAESPVYYQATPPTSAPTGSIWVDSDAFVPSIDSAQMLRWRKTMTGGQTSLSGTDDSGLPLSYTPGYEQLYINGVLQVRGQDYVATTGTTVTGLTALVVNDVVEVFSVVARAVGDVYTQSQSDSKYSPKVSTGMGLIVPTSISVGGGTGSVAINGKITFSGVSGITINGAFSSTYDIYRIVLSGISASSTSTYLRWQMASGGNTVSTSTYSHQRIYAQNTTIGTLSGINISALPFTVVGSSALSFATLEVMNPFLSTVTKTLSHGNYSDPTYPFYQELHTGYHSTASSYDGITISPEAGTISGTIRIYGYNNGA